MRYRREIFYYRNYFQEFYSKQKDLIEHIMKKKNKHLTSLDEHLDKEYGKKGTPVRNRFEREFEAFKIGILIQEARKKKQLTQEQLALKVGTTKNYISRIENDASDIRLSTLIRIIKDGLDGSLTLSLN